MFAMLRCGSALSCALMFCVVAGQVASAATPSTGRPPRTLSADVRSQPLIPSTARPLVANRPIFTVAAPTKPPAKATVGRAPAVPEHRRLPIAPAAKNAAAAGQGSTTGATSGKPAPAPPRSFAPNTAHRVPLGW